MSRSRSSRQIGRRKCRNTPCDCWLCTPGYLKRRMLREREQSRELQRNRVTYQNRRCVER